MAKSTSRHTSKPVINRSYANGPHKLRIIGGRWRGRKLTIANIEGLRPTGDRVRETLFNWLMTEVQESRCLDMFSGSGALGLECLSRGAKEVIFLEQHPLAAKHIKTHCNALLNQENCSSSASVIQCNSIAWLKKPTIDKHSLDLVFIDPPFADDLWKAAIEALDKAQILKAGGLIYIETPRGQRLTTPHSWKCIKEKSSGEVCFRLFCYREIG